MGFFEETQVCEVHGFVLSPDGTCVRCRNENLRARKRRKFATFAAGGLTGAMVVTGALVAWGHARGRTAEAVTVAVASAPVDVSSEAPSAISATRSDPDTATPPHLPDEWDRAMARADAERAAEAARQRAAEKARQVSALELPNPPPRDPPRRADPPTPREPSMWDEPRQPSRMRYTTRFGATAAGTAYALPINNGGNFGNHQAGH